MKDQIEVDGVWYPCELFFPYQAEPVLEPEFGAPPKCERTQYRRFNALVIMSLRGPIIRLGEYRIIMERRTLIFQLCKAEMLHLWGNVRE